MRPIIVLIATASALLAGSIRRPRPVVAAAGRQCALPLEVGGRRRAWRGQPHEARNGPARGPADPHRRGLRARAGAVLDDAVLRHPAVRHLHEAYRHESRTRTRRGSNEEIVVGEIGQVGTQFDGFSHQTIGNSMYNCFKLDETSTRTGFTKLGIEHVGGLMTRGVLIDVAALKGVEMLPDTYEITVADLQQALKRQSLTLQPGDAVIIHTGWGRLWGKDNARYTKSCPGIGVAAAEWLARQDPMLVGSDNWGIGVSPRRRSAGEQPGPSDHAGRQRHSPAGKPEARRGGGEARLRVRADGATAQDPGRHGLDRRADRGAVSTALNRRSEGQQGQEVHSRTSTIKNLLIS